MHPRSVIREYHGRSRLNSSKAIYIKCLIFCEYIRAITFHRRPATEIGKRDSCLVTSILWRPRPTSYQPIFVVATGQSASTINSTLETEGHNHSYSVLSKLSPLHRRLNGLIVLHCRSGLVEARSRGSVVEVKDRGWRAQPRPCR
jgi:hypothetical protein